MNLTIRFEEALIYAAQLHSTQIRKGTNTPYIASQHSGGMNER